MIKAVAAATILIVISGIVAFAWTQSSGNAASLQTKIDTIKKANADKLRSSTQTLDVFEPELEEYVRTSMKKDLPVQVESIRAHLTPGMIAADTRLTIPPGSTGSIILDALVGGTHTFNIKGKLTGAKGVGKFDLQSVYVDSIPLPHILFEALVKHFAKSKYPDVDLRAPFDLPWGIDAINVAQSKAAITY